MQDTMMKTFFLALYNNRGKDVLTFCFSTFLPFFSFSFFQSLGSSGWLVAVLLAGAVLFFLPVSGVKLSTMVKCQFQNGILGEISAKHNCINKMISSPFIKCVKIGNDWC